jgi:hypothetical protein
MTTVFSRLLTEPLATLPHAARQRDLDSSTVWRWARRGVALPNGTTLRLEVLEIDGRHLVTSLPALDRMVEAVRAARSPSRRTPDGVRSPQQRA